MSLRVLFVSGTAIGGSARSTGELAASLSRRGHHVGVLWGTEGPGRRRHLHTRAVNLRVKLGPSPLAAPVGAAAATIGRRPARRRVVDRVTEWDSILPENSFPQVSRYFRPDVVVASSIDRMAWRRIRDLLAGSRVPGVLYLREENGLGHLTISQAPPDLLLANSEALATSAGALGHPAVAIPSVVTLERSRVESSRQRILLVNPQPMFGLDIAVDLARARPELPFTFQESWPLTDEEHAGLDAVADELGNVLIRRPVPDPRDVYRDAMILLAPYRTNGRPRIVLEAQANGIPVLGSDVAALREAIGPGGATVAVDAPPETWRAALAALVDDPARYEEAAAAARRHAQRPDVDPEVVTGRFEEELLRLVATATSA